ncbi:STAS domain-containing protein [bacterium]|nr:STAS domain-containing protein [bacterium]
MSMQPSESNAPDAADAQRPPHAIESGGSFFLDLAEIQKLIDDRWGDAERGPGRLEARETLLVSLAGSLTANQQPQLRAYFEGRVQKSKFRRIVLDLKDVQYMDSSAVGIVAWLKKTLAAEGGSLKVLANATLYGLFEALRMVDFLGVVLAPGRER